MPLVVALTVVAVLAAIGLIVYAVVMGGRTNPDLFTVTDGVLTEYRGTDERTVTLPDGVVVVGERAFLGHTEIEKLVFPVSLTTLRNGAFYGCAELREVKFDRALSFIGDAAFGECSTLTSVTLPASVQYIHSEAFYADISLREILTAEGNESYQSRDGVLYSADGKTLVLYPAGREAESFAVPAEVEIISLGAFLGNPYLREVDLGSVKEVGESAFSGCRALERVNVPGTVETIYDSAFADCGSLSDLRFAEGFHSLQSTVFANCTALTRVELPESTEVIGMECFHGCTALTYASIPSMDIAIHESAFTGCDALTLYCPAGSVTEAFANDKGIPCKPLE